MLKSSYCNFCKLMGHDDKDYRTMELMRERISNTYRVQAYMMTGKTEPHFNQVLAHITLHQNNITLRNHNIISCSIIRYLSTTPCKEINIGTKVEDEVEEALKYVEDKWYSITIKNQGTMQENVHFHLRHVCIVTHKIMTQKIVQYYWGISRKREIKTIIMFNGFMHKQGMMEEIST
jgi:ribosomal protein S18